MKPALHTTELELDESELFDGASDADTPQPVVATEAVAMAPLLEQPSGGESESDDDGIVLEGSSSESGEDEVEMSLRNRMTSLQSSMDPTAGAPIHAVGELSSSHCSQVGSLKSFSSSKGKRLFSSDGDLAGACSMPVSAPLHAGRRRVMPEPPVASSYGVYGLGTSMPITIPMLQRRGSGPVFAGDDPAGPATFVPPHLIQRSGEGGEGGASGAAGLAASQPGASPSNEAKRERLRARNAILRKTGFIEVQPPVAPALELLEPVKVAVLLAADGEASNQSADTALGSVPVPGAVAAIAPGGLAASLERRVQASSLTALLGTSK